MSKTTVRLRTRFDAGLDIVVFYKVNHEWVARAFLAQRKTVFVTKEE
jgi:hypothetical protein